jgi:hypothetical protein
MDQPTTKTAEQTTAKEEGEIIKALTHDPIWLNTVRGAVTVYGHELISKHTLNIIGACLNLPEFEEADHGLYELVFTTEDVVDSDGNKAYAMFFPDPKAIVVSLPKVWDNSIEEALSEEKHVSVVCAIHHNLLFHVFHDIHHAASHAAGIDIFNETEDEETKAGDWANDKIVELAKIVDIEPTWQDEPWFSPLIKEFFLNIDEKEKDPKALQAKEMIEKGTLICDREEGKDDLIISSFREFVKLLNDDPDGWDDQVLTKNFLSETMAPTTPKAYTNTEEMVEKNVLTDNMGDLPWADAENEGVMFGGASIKTTDHPESLVAATFGGNPVATNQPAPILPSPPAQIFPTITPDTNAALPSLPNPGTPDIARIMEKVYMACYQHIFANCGLLVNSDVAFQNPQFVLSTPVDLNVIPGAKEIIVGADINDPESGVFQVKVPVVNGMLLGNIKKNTMLPGYTLHLNVNGEYSTRALIPQNPVTGSTTAIRARAGNAIMWIIDGAKARDDGGRWKFKIENGIITPCQQFGAPS